jgi:hypothetical protein
MQCPFEKSQLPMSSLCPNTVFGQWHAGTANGHGHGDQLNNRTLHIIKNYCMARVSHLFFIVHCLGGRSFGIWVLVV